MSTEDYITGVPPEEQPDDQPAPDAATTPDNEADQSALHSELADQKADREEELTEAEQKKQRVLGSIADKTVTVRIDGDHRAKFTRIMGDEEERFRELERKARNDDLTEEEDDRAEAWMNELLTEHAVSDWIDGEFIESLPSQVKMTTFGDVVQGGEEAEEGGNLPERTPGRS